MMRWLSPVLLGMTLSMAAHAAPAAEKLATIEVSVDDAKVGAKAAGIRTLYIIVYDADSPMPMPYGALKVDLKADAKGSIYKGELTTANIQVMGQRPAPKNVRLKARLDKDGSAGKDQAGDFVGTVDVVKAGGDAKVVINTAI